MSVLIFCLHIRYLRQAYLALIVFTPTSLPRSTAETFYYSAKNPEKPLALSPLSAPATLGLSIIVPAFNERERLGVMVDEALIYLSDAVYDPELKKGSGLNPTWYEDGVELVIVDDGSEDDTARIAIDLASGWEKKLQARRAISGEKRHWPPLDMRVIKLERNRGKGGAVRHVSYKS
jgi:dolichyl-phosphate beta-glucosyltransferase